jgi:hypothetical protein
MAPQTAVGQGLLVIEDTLSHSVIHTTVGTTPLDELSARRIDLYLTPNNTHKRQTSMHPGGIRTRNPSKRAVADPRHRGAATGTGINRFNFRKLYFLPTQCSYMFCTDLRTNSLYSINWLIFRRALRSKIQNVLYRNHVRLSVCDVTKLIVDF